jgi:3-methyladenine DNA glycosylase AlkD
MTAETLDIRKEIHEYCVTLADEANVLKYSRYFKEGHYNGYGLTSKQIYAGAKELLKVPGLTFKTLLDEAPEIISHGKYEETSIMMLMVKGFHKQFSKDTFFSISSWYKYGISNWAHADTLGMLILPLFLQKNLISISDFQSWLISENKFQRRSVPVTLIKILKTRENYKDLFTFIECLMSDPEREVHQGTGWFLREAWKKKPSETEEFLLKWKDSAPRLIVQYASEKMTADGKARFKRKKS